MYTLNSLISHFVEAGKLWYVGQHFRDDEPVYVGDLWRLWPDPSGLESKNKNRLEELAGRKGIQLRFEDEIISDESGRAHEINPGYHGQVATWKMMADGSIWAEDEAQDNPGAYIDALLDSRDLKYRSDRWLTDEQLESQGFNLFDFEAESGFHAGQTDTPDGVVKLVKETVPDATDFIFQITDVGQFDCRWRVWYRLPDTEED